MIIDLTSDDDDDTVKVTDKRSSAGDVAKESGRVEDYAPVFTASSVFAHLAFVKTLRAYRAYVTATKDTSDAAAAAAKVLGDSGPFPNESDFFDVSCTDTSLEERAKISSKAHHAHEELVRASSDAAESLVKVVKASSSAAVSATGPSDAEIVATITMLTTLVTKASVKMDYVDWCALAFRDLLHEPRLPFSAIKYAAKTIKHASEAADTLASGLAKLVAKSFNVSQSIKDEAANLVAENKAAGKVAGAAVSELCKIDCEFKNLMELVYTNIRDYASDEPKYKVLHCNLNNFVKRVLTPASVRYGAANSKKTA